MSDRGFISWKPRGESLERVDMARAIIAQYQAYLPLTIRQIFYRAVGAFGYDKNEKAYKRLIYTLSKARRADMVDMSAIRDDGVTKRSAPGYESLDSFERRIKAAARGYSRQGQLGQEGRIVLLCEAAGMVPQLERVANPFGVDVRSSGGYDSVTAKHELACDLLDLERRVTVLHLGDLDPSGEDMFTVISEDVGAFFDQMNLTDIGAKDERRSVRFERIAVTREQAALYELPSAPKKETDSRAKKFQGETVQCEALPPDTLNAIVREAITSRLDMQAFAANADQEKRELAVIDTAIKKLSFKETTR